MDLGKTGDWIAKKMHGADAIVSSMQGQDTLANALHQAFKMAEPNKKTWYRIAENATNEAGETYVNRYWDARKIFGGMLGVSAAGRIASGGGIYKDSNGNTDIIGIPFI